MAELLLRIVREEGPIHEDELVTRVRDLWGLGRAGNRIQEAVANGVRFLLVSQQCTREDGFLNIPNASVPIRNREKVSSSTLRKPDFLPLSEIRAAIHVIIDIHHGATAAEIPVAVARVLGFKNTSGHLRRVIENQTARLKRLGTITEASGMVKRVESCA